MQPILTNQYVTLYNDDCLHTVRQLGDNSIDAIITDPPYEIDLKTWDNTGIAFNTTLWAECLRVLKPGAYCLVFGATRTFHRVMVALEDAGFQLVNTIAWITVQGMPHGEWGDHAVDRALGKKDPREPIGKAETSSDTFARRRDFTEPYQTQTEEAKPFRLMNPWLKPAYEPIIVAQKPFNTSVGKNLLQYGTGAFNFAETAISANMEHLAQRYQQFNTYDWNTGRGGDTFRTTSSPRPAEPRLQGRYPSNVIIAQEALDDTIPPGFFFCPKASGNERPAVQVPTVSNPHTEAFDRQLQAVGLATGQESYPADILGIEAERTVRVAHPTVKPLALMRYLINLVSRPEGVLFEPFAGSGSTLQAAAESNRAIIASELNAMYIPLIMKRMNQPIQRTLF